MADTSLAINTVDQSGKKIQKALTDINPNADTTALKTFAQGLNNLTDNTYVGSVRVIKTDLDNAVPETSKTDRQMNLIIVPDSGDSSIVTDGKAYQSSMTAGAFYGVSLSGYEDCYANYGYFESDSSGIILYGNDSTDSTGASFCFTNPNYAGRVVKFYAPETDTYAEAQAEITIVGGE